MGAYAELRELKIQAAPRHLVLSVAENLDEVEFAFAEGAGLGLDIVLSLLVHLGSDIKLGSEKNKGTTFYFDLPFVLGEKDEGADLAVRLEDEKDLTGKSVLLVEDNILNQKVAERFLSNQGLNVTIAENGEVALEKMQSIEFDLVLIDVQMPVIDGIEASKRIRSSKASRNQIPIIALTANAGDSVEETVLEAGMNDFVTKPFQPDKLNHILRHWIP